MVATATLLTRSIQGESLSAATDRLINLAMKQGVIDFVDDSFEVLEDTGSNMVITIGSGSAFDRAVIEGDNAGQGLFVAEHQNATQTLSVAASDPTNDRIDRVIVRVFDDTFDSSGDDFSDLEVITGTPDASPSAPAEPSSAYTLATILVQNSVTAITDSDITDLRFEAPIRGQLVETQYHTSDGSFVKADHPWLARIRVQVQAAGGGGGGVALTGAAQASASGGGGGGEWASKEVAVAAISASETITVGVGGAGGAAGANNGTVGENSSFGSHVNAGGGSGGGGAAASTVGGYSAFASTGGTGGTGGDIHVKGGGTHPVLLNIVRMHMAQGGGSQLSHPAAGAANSTGAAGTVGQIYGGGGDGAFNTDNQGAGHAGGVGADGIVIIELYA